MKPMKSIGMTPGDLDIIRTIAEMKEMTVAELRDKYREVFDVETTVTNKTHLWKKIAYRLQEIKHGGLSPEAKARLEELGKEAPERLFGKRKQNVKASASSNIAALPRDPRIPPVGTIINRNHQGVEHCVVVLENGFEYEGRTYKSLSAIARKITGTGWNGFGFFGLLGGDKR